MSVKRGQRLLSPGIVPQPDERGRHVRGPADCPATGRGGRQRGARPPNQTCVHAPPPPTGSRRSTRRHISVPQQHRDHRVARLAVGTGGHDTGQHLPSSHTVPPFHRQGDPEPTQSANGSSGGSPGPPSLASQVVNYTTLGAGDICLEEQWTTSTDAPPSSSRVTRLWVNSLSHVSRKHLGRVNPRATRRLCVPPAAPQDPPAGVTRARPHVRAHVHTCVLLLLPPLLPQPPRLGCRWQSQELVSRWGLNS